METKICKVCGRELPISEFKKTGMSPNGIRTCNKCCAEKSRMAKEAKAIAKEKEDGIGNTPSNQSECNPALAGFSTRSLIEELRARGYSGTLIFKKEIVI